MNKYLITFLFLFTIHLTFAQKNFIDQPFVEITAKVDTLVVPDKIFISIQIKEADSRNKKSVEEQGDILYFTLKRLNIDTEKDLTLLDFSSNFKNYFLKGQNIVKSKMYSLVVKDAVKAGTVLAELEKVGISNVNVDRTEYSNSEELLLILKSKAVKKSKITAEKLAEPLNQKIGKALYISDGNSISNELQGQAQGIIIRGMSSLYGARGSEPIFIEFDKMKFGVQVNVKYELE